MKRLMFALTLFVCGALVGTLILGQYLQGQVAKSAAGATQAPVHPKELTSYREVVKRVLPAVVSIESQVKPKVSKAPKSPKSPSKSQSPGDDPRIPEEFRKFFKEFRGQSFDFQMPDQAPRGGFGSGFIVDPKGVILTNHHVVDGATQVVVHLQDGSRFVSKDIHGDRKTDLAIVRIDPKGKSLPHLELGDSDAMEIGDRVLAVGAPFGLTGTVTAGIVSAKGRNGLNMNMYEDFLQTDAAINPGNSGGPLVNLEGKVVGINAAIKTRTGGFQGVGLAVASNLAKNIMKSLLHDGAVHRGYLGVQIKDLTKEVAQQLGLNDKNCVIVGKVYDGSPAANAGLKSGDIITTINGKPVKEGRVLQTVVAGLPLNKAIPVQVVRDGKTMTLHVNIKEQPSEFGTAEEQAPRHQPKGQKGPIALEKVGLEVTDLTSEMAEELGFKKDTKGAVITAVEPNSAAAEAGLRKGFLITKVNKKAVASAAAVKEALKKVSLDKGVLLQVQSPQGGVDYVVLKAETVK
jgi:serine protease Do